MRLHLALAFSAVTALPLVAVAQSPHAAWSNRLTGDGLSAYVVENLPGGGHRYVNVAASQVHSVKGDQESAQVGAYQSYADATGWGYRQIWCSLPGVALEVKKNSGGRFTATLDSGNSACWSFGSRYDAVGGQTIAWPFSSELATLALSHPLYTIEGNSHRVSNDKVSGVTYRDNCKEFSGYGASGVMSLGAQTWNVGPDSGSGSIQERACNSKVK